jgi:hypothetical protein
MLQPENLRTPTKRSFMTKRLLSNLSALILISTSGVLMAQDYEYHPALSDTFFLSVGAMRSSNSFKLKSNLGDDIGDEIDFDDTLDVSDHSTFLDSQLRWKFGKEKKWSLFGQYFSNNAKGETELTEDVEWEGLTFLEGSFVNAGVKIEVARVFVGRSFIKNEQNDFGIGVGLHRL